MRTILALAFGILFPVQAFALQTIQVGIVGDATNHQVSWTSEVGVNYLVEMSPDLVDWVDTGIVEAGTGSIVTCGFSTPTELRLFYRIRKRPGAVRPGFDEVELAATDDGSTGQIPIGFSINFSGTTWNDCYVNNNGNITFEGPQSEFTPSPLQSLGVPIIAPFWADVDTTGEVADAVTYSYGIEFVNGRQAFGVNWVNVGYFEGKDDKLNSFQLILIDRSDVAVGDFDIEFNYDTVLWETGDESGGVYGYGGEPSHSGLSNGINQGFEFQYSGQTLVQLDSNPITEVPNFITGLIYRSRNSTTPGRFVFQSRSGLVLGALSVDAGEHQILNSGATSVVLDGAASIAGGGDISVHWSILEGSAGVIISNPSILNPTVTIPSTESFIMLQLTATSVADPTMTSSDFMIIVP